MHIYVFFPIIEFLYCGILLSRSPYFMLKKASRKKKKKKTVGTEFIKKKKFLSNLGKKQQDYINTE